MVILKITRIIGRNIRKYRKAIGMTQIQLAEQVKMEKETISRIELGKYNVSLKGLERFAEALHVPPLELLRDEPVTIDNQTIQLAEILQTIDNDERKIIIDILLNTVRLCKIPKDNSLSAHDKKDIDTAN